MLKAAIRRNCVQEGMLMVSNSIQMDCDIQAMSD